MTNDLLERVAQAYRADEFRQAKSVDALLDAGGLLFTWKRGRAGRLRNLRVVAEIGQPRIRFSEWHNGLYGVLEGHSVWLEDGNGARVHLRTNAREPFPYGVRLAHWDPLDFLYFFGYALWNYFTLPALLRDERVAWNQTGDAELTAEFPPEIPTHCPTQVFRFDPATSLVSHHRYTAEVFGNWAHAWHTTSEYRNTSGVPFASRRRVYPQKFRGDGHQPFPLLIWADIHDYRVVG